MIPFKMKILKYNTNGSYSVEYTPEDEKCTPIKLEIYVNVNDSSNTNEVLTMLKNSSPQDYWRKEIRSSTGIDHNALQRLVNTEHSVNTINEAPEETVITGETSPIDLAPRQIVNGTTTPSRSQLPAGSTPEQVASPGEVAAIRLRVAIQHVLQEMAEGTV
jgi:hypothetical protein